MKPELVGQQLRLRVRSPSLFSRLRTLDPGAKGRMQIIIGKRKNAWLTQSYRLNLRDYKNVSDALDEFDEIADKINLSNDYYIKGVKLIEGWFWRKR